MKIYKSITLTELSNADASVGETIVCPTKENPNDYQVWLQRIKGIYTPCGKFTDLKTAIKYAERLENPTLIKQGYQVVELDHRQKLIIYYDQLEGEVKDYILNSEHITHDVIQLNESGISVRFASAKETEIEQQNRLHKRDELVWFGQYLLSDERRKLFSTHPVFGTDNLEERLKQVHHSDYENFKVWQRNRPELYDLSLDENDQIVKTRTQDRGMTSDRDYEMRLLYEVNTMCEESLSEESFQSYKNIVKELIQNRKGLKA